MSEIGQIASKMWYEIPVHFPFIGLDAFVVMPDHIHGIIVINRSIEIPLVGALHATPLPLLSVRPGNCTISENIFQIMIKTGIQLFDYFQNPSFSDYFKRRSENMKYTF